MREFDLKKELKQLPDRPGVYLMHDADDHVIYVGKAKVLKNRVRSYFDGTEHNGHRAASLMLAADDTEDTIFSSVGDC